jgi:hypothetical protein
MTRQRQPRVEYPAYLAWLRKKACRRCGADHAEAAHVRMASAEYDKRETGKGERPSDCWAVPLCSSCHTHAPDSQHQVGEAAFWGALGIDPCALAWSLWQSFLYLHPNYLEERAPRRPRAKKPRAPRPKTKIPSRSFPKGRTFKQERNR